MTGTPTLLARVPQKNFTLAGLVPAMNARTWWCGGVLAGLSALALSSMATPARQFGPTHDNVRMQHTEFVAAPFVVSRGMVEAIRELADENGDRRFEMSIRMRDGTLRVSQEAGGGQWRAGDSVSLIGGPTGR